MHRSSYSRRLTVSQTSPRLQSWNPLCVICPILCHLLQTYLQSIQRNLLAFFWLASIPLLLMIWMIQKMNYGVSIFLLSALFSSQVSAVLYAVLWLSHLLSAHTQKAQTILSRSLEHSLFTALTLERKLTLTELLSNIGVDYPNAVSLIHLPFFAHSLCVSMLLARRFWMKLCKMFLLLFAFLNYFRQMNHQIMVSMQAND